MYEPVPKIPDFPALERRHLAFWAEQRIFEKLRARNAGGEPWSFLDGPITANNPMGVHHAWGRSYKDMFQRYYAMRGFDERFQNGFDCQGLWVEVEVEKELGFETRREILDYGIDRFVNRCKERVLTYAARQTEQSVRLGYWCDWDDPATLLALRDALREGAGEITITTPSGREVSASPSRHVGRLGSPDYGGSYFTFSDENNYTIWQFLKKCHEEGFIYRGTDVMPWCCRCGTGLSQMEVAEGRKVTSHTSVFVRFPLRGREREALLAWTTTPWTLTSNVAAAVNPEMAYLKVRHGDWIYYLGKENLDRERVQSLEAAGRKETHKLQSLRSILKGSGELEILAELPGSELVGLAYDGPYDHFPALRQPGGLDPYDTAPSEKSGVQCHRVVPWSEVSGAEGTGIVHIAPGCGAEDQELGREHDLVVIAPLTGSGRYLEGFDELTGRHVLEVADDIVADLRRRGVLLARETYPHVYPHCWRCKEELVFRLVDEWFIGMGWRDRIQKIVGDVRWIPPEGEAREQDWLKNMGDWMISKKRFWGLALPIWVCGECEHFSVVGGPAELRKRAVEGWEEFEGHSPHRPWIDRVKIRCGECGGVATRVEDVGNPWLDAGIVPFSTVHYGTNRDYWRRWFPADFVVESFPGQFRNWFYSLLAMSAMMVGRAPFKTLLGYALVLDARGEEMHKSAGNSIAFDEAAEALGAELMRYIYAARNPSHNLLFPDLDSTGTHDTHTAEEARRKLLTLWNCYSFFVTYATVDSWRPSRPPDREAASELDRWILSRLQHLVEVAHSSFEAAAVYRLMARFEQFNDELSNWYLRRSRRRFWKSESDTDKESAYRTLYTTLTTLARVMAPLLPFLAEEMHRNLVCTVNDDAPASVHLEPYPEVDAAWVDDELERQVACVIRTKNMALGLRAKANVKVRQPLGTLYVRPQDADDREVLADPGFVAQVLEECNVKQLRLIEDDAELVSSSVRPNFKALGPRYGRQMKAVAKHLTEVDAATLQSALAGGGTYCFELEGTEVEIGEGDVEIVHEAPEHLPFAHDQGTFVALDTSITAELEREGIARDLNRQAQQQRKAIGLEVSDRITVELEASDRIAEAAEEHREYLRRELLAERVERVESVEGGVEAKAGGETVRLLLRRA